MAIFLHAHKNIDCQLVLQEVTDKKCQEIVHKNRCYIFLSLNLIKKLHTFQFKVIMLSHSFSLMISSEQKYVLRVLTF